ncbi:MAG TPA: DUF4920 domain-containing protein [Labilithrix sp.]|jgi:hypothetical protein|nr:DUF4920 domain-containing protein [Labilithrix sp.]
MRTLLAPLLVALLASQAFGCTTKVIKKMPGETGTSAEPTEEAAAEGTEGTGPAPAPETVTAPEAEKFGDPIDPNTRVVSLAEVLANPEAFKDQLITTHGAVRQVCQKRGCWAEIRPEESRDSETMRVTFKGYAFFLPKDSRGANVKIEGRVSVQLLNAEQVAHLESEGATFTNKKPDGSALATEFIAAGVEMTGRKK